VVLKRHKVVALKCHRQTRGLGGHRYLFEHCPSIGLCGESQRVKVEEVIFIKKWIKGLYALKSWQKFIYLTCVGFLILLPILVGKWLLIIYGLIMLVLILYYLLSSLSFKKLCTGNGIIYGGRGKGKGLLFQKRINFDKKAFSNIDYGSSVEVIDPIEYIQSIGNNTIIDAILGNIKIVTKIEKFEGVNFYLDDTTIYFPNFEDNLLKKTFPSMPLTLAVNRHLYDAFMLINVQSAERPYKILRELQTDFSIKALKTYGTSSFWQAIPILRNYMGVKYRYYEEEKAREEGVLPFSGVGLVNKGAKHVYLTSGQSTKEVHLAKYGKVLQKRVWINRKHIYYDTRYFHKVFYGVEAPKKV